MCTLVQNWIEIKTLYKFHQNVIQNSFWKAIKLETVLCHSFGPAQQHASGLVACAGPRPSSRVLPALLPCAQAATWAWARKLTSRLGHNRPEAISAVDREWTAVRAPRWIKTGGYFLNPNPRLILSFSSPSFLPCRRRIEATDGRWVAPSPAPTGTSTPFLYSFLFPSVSPQRSSGGCRHGHRRRWW
jgi:hypothetical protein